MTTRSTLSLDIDGSAFEPTFVHGSLGLSVPVVFQVRAFVAGAGPKASDLVGLPFSLSIHDPFSAKLSLHGLVVSATRSLEHQGSAHYELSLGSPAHALTIGRNSRVFQDLTVVDVAKKVLETASIPADNVRFALEGSYPSKPYRAQYRETDWTFLTRILGEEGIYTHFELDDDKTVLVFADNSTAAPPIDGEAALPFHEGGGLRAVQQSVSHLRSYDRVTSDALRLRDYAFEKPRLSLDSTAGSGGREVYRYRGRFRVPAEGDRLAKVALEARQCGGATVSGRTACSRLRPGLMFEVTDHPVAALNNRYFLTQVQVTAVESREAGGRQATFLWQAIALDQPFRPLVLDPIRRPGGVQTGIVVGPSGEEIHPDQSGRVRAQLYWDREGKKDDKASTWMRVGQFALGGSMLMPRVGWDMVVGFEEGDADEPVILSHLYDGKLRPPYSLPDNKTRTAWQTATTPGGGSSNEVRFEDKAGSEEIFINSSKDTLVTIGDNKSETVGVDHTEEVGSNLSADIGSNMQLGVGADQTVTVGGSETLTVSGNREVAVGASESATIGGSRTLSVSSGASLDATGGRSRTVGGSMTALSALGVSRAVLGSLSVTIGGSWITAAAAGLGNVTGGAGAETVGGAKIEVGAKGCTLSVKGAAAETVGGAYVIAAGGNAGETATGALAITVGGAFIGNAPKVSIEADSEISIRVGGASITVKASSVELKAPALASPAAKVVKVAGNITHN